MLKDIAMWGGFAGLVLAVIAIVIMFVLRQNIINILNKDAILFNQNFEIKKQAIANALNLVDELYEKGNVVKSNFDFATKAKACYNDLMCVATNLHLADEFYYLTINTNADFSPAKILKFKYHCRKDIGLKTKVPAIKEEKQKMQTNNFSGFANSMPQPSEPVQFVPSQPITPNPTPVQKTEQPRPVQPVQRPEAKPVQPAARPAQPTARPVQPSQPAQRPVQRPVQAATRPAQPKPPVKQ